MMLRQGDRVALVSPAGPAAPDLVAQGVAILRSWGLAVDEPVLAGGPPDKLNYLAASDAARAAEFTAAWLNPEVKAVICVRGGYGCMRMADQVDWASLPPKLFVGSSDVTTLHAELHTLGRSSLFGPMPGTEAFVKDPVAQANLKRALFAPKLWFDGGATMAPGVARGVLIGGNLTLLAANIPQFTPPHGAIVLLEDIGEEPYRVDRMLTQLIRAGFFDGVAGLLLGSWTGCGDVGPVLEDRLRPLEVPILSDFGFGHCAGQLSLPLGVRAELDADLRTLKIL
ncbi:muramoyltetrapeptide carboxypeptidase [Lentzea sp. NBRC 105346]|uniref:S66 peptidase family protein n=1 Tax=Lentzea sp. NBRC 105346 TaxID=3032205 RepID=UPI0024A57F20|nr:LD-carboxypeptidase [Lentzea sp. NBRC 105346]GLZ28351.1 muramoyltetrapeptide carboxypeptidase [Lentzea sp. NBRC 105346]